MDDAGLTEPRPETSQRNRAPRNAQLAASSVADSSAQGNAPDAKAATRPKKQNGAGPIFTVPDREFLQFAVEMDGVDGIADADSYLIITADKKKFRAFVVPKDNPDEQHEISIVSGKLDTNRHEFHADFGQGHNLFLQTSDRGVTGSLDGHSVRVIEDYHEQHSLIKEKHLQGGTFGATPELDATMVHEEQYVEGDSWTFMQKDFKTGRILKFTQSGTTSGVTQNRP